MKLFGLILLFCAVLATAAADTRLSTKRLLGVDDVWAKGTKVSKEFEDGWYEGTIKAHHQGMYTVEWSDGDHGTFSPAEINQMVSDEKHWENGTRVYKEFKDGWWQGTITNYKDFVYTVTWSDGSTDSVKNDDIDQMVADASNIPDNKPKHFFPFGTLVWKEFPDGFQKGTVTDFNEKKYVYTITWSDGSIEKYHDLDEVDDMVEAGAEHFGHIVPQKDTLEAGSEGRSNFLVAFIIIAVVGAGAAIFFKYQRRAKSAKEIADDFNLNDIKEEKMPVAII